MRPYIIINGVSSNTINGLLIQSLPPISKPPIRTNVEEIDGRDGDVVEILGFGAYDKTFSIGLYGDYNVNDVIAYLNTSGIITFSNERDKYYKFATYQQIDLEKLIRFKQAQVTIHVQPFKYSADEKEILNTYPSGTTRAVISVRNNGNIYSKPTLTVTGSGAVDILINNKPIFTLNLSDHGESIILDAESMNATAPNGNYLNRKVSGDYDNLRLNTGVNAIAVNGDITDVDIANYSRWI